MTRTRKIYLAARYSRNDEMRGIRDVLVALGYEITSRWIDQHGGVLEQSYTPAKLNAAPEKCAVLGQHDLNDLKAADTVISFTSADGGGKGGRHVEHGLALGLGKQVIVCGPLENIFHTLPSVERFSDWPALARDLAGRFEVRNSSPVPQIEWHLDGALAATGQGHGMTSNAVLQSLRVLAEAAHDRRITLDPHGAIRIDNTPANPFQQLAVSVLHQWGWITWTPSVTLAHATLTQRGHAELAKHCGPDFTDTTQWRAFEHWMFAVEPDEIGDES